MMFGIPAICLAIYKAAYKENKEMVKGIMEAVQELHLLQISLSLLNLVSCFFSPMLYVIHALLPV